MQKTDQWRDQIAYYRFLNNEKVREEDLIQCASDHCVAACQRLEEVLLIQDTTELNLEPHRHRITGLEGLGTVGNGSDLGFFCHPTIVVNPRDGALMGVADIYIMARERERGEDGNYQKKGKHHGRTVAIEEKETRRWIERGIGAKERLPGVKRVTVVQDREGDIYESFYLLREGGLDFVIRANHDRKVVGAEGEREGLKEQAENLSPTYEYTLEVAGDRRGRKKRTARMEVRYGQVRLLRPKQIGGGNKRYPREQEVWMVQVREKGETVPSGERGIEWMLYSSQAVTSPEGARKIIGYYQKRWIIEDVFRTVKSEGLRYEETELEKGKALRKLLVMAFMAAVQILQLRQEREGKTEQEPSLVFSEEQLACMEDLLEKIEGKTEQQKNPWPKHNLAWASWMIARLGGWKGYTSQRPPGVITLYEGWVRFHDIFRGWLVAKDVYKR
jgi:hypothetical protein